MLMTRPGRTHHPDRSRVSHIQKAIGRYVPLLMLLIDAYHVVLGLLICFGAEREPAGRRLLGVLNRGARKGRGRRRARRRHGPKLVDWRRHRGQEYRVALRRGCRTTRQVGSAVQGMGWGGGCELQVGVAARETGPLVRRSSFLNLSKFSNRFGPTCPRSTLRPCPPSSRRRGPCPPYRANQVLPVPPPSSPLKSRRVYPLVGFDV